MSTTIKASFFWSAGNGLRLNGERSDVLACAKSIDLLYHTLAGEKLINHIKQIKPIFHCPEGSQSAQEILHVLLSNSSWSEQEQHQQKQLILNQLEKHHDIELEFDPFPFITLHSPPDGLRIMLQRMRTIHQYPLGAKLFEDMAACQKKLVIMHDKSSINAGGYASAQRSTFDVYRPGFGADARVRYRFDMPENGTHLVTAINNTMIPFTALDILFHELVHAKHIMCGTMSRGDSERQAILEENTFRAQREETRHLPARDWRAYEQDQQVWFGY